MCARKYERGTLKQFAIFGLGRFGLTLASRLSELGHEVVAVDSDEAAVNQAASLVTHAFVADATDELVLKGLDLKNFDAAIVAIGTLEPNILTTFKLKKLGAERIIGRALHNLHAEILTMMGASNIVFPERDMAIRLAHNLNASTIMDFLELAPDFSMAEVIVPPDLVGVEIRNSKFRNQYQATIVAVERGGERIIAPGGSFKFKENDHLYVIGNTASLENLASLIRESEQRLAQHF